MTMFTDLATPEPTDEGLYVEHVEYLDADGASVELFRDDAGRYWWWSCSPGCLPDADPIGPYDTRAEAAGDAADLW